MSLTIANASSYEARTDTGIAASTAHTFACRIRKDTATTNSTQAEVLFNGGTNGNTSITDFGTDLYMISADGGTQATYQFTYTLSQWYHLAIVRDATNAVCYVDGVQVDSQAQNLPSTTSSNWYIGHVFGNNAGSTFEDVCIYDAALSADEIMQLYLARLPKRRNNLIAHYPCFAGARTLDQSGNARTLTENGTVTDGVTHPPVGWGTPAAIRLTGQTTTLTIGGAADTKFGANLTAAATKTAGGAAATTFGGAITVATLSQIAASSAATAFGGTATLAALKQLGVSAADTKFGGTATATGGASPFAGAGGNANAIRRFTLGRRRMRR